MTSLDQTTIIPALEGLDNRARNSGFDRWDQGSDIDHFRRKQTALTQLAWILPAIVTAGLGLFRPTWSNLNGSELNIWATAHLGNADLMRIVEEFDSPYPIIMWGWAQAAGTSDIALRIPSIAFMAGAAALIGVLGSRLATPKVGFVAGLLFAALPITSRFAHEVGPLALALFSAALATLCLVRLLNAPRLHTAFFYAAAAAVLLLSGIGAASVVLAHLVAVVVLRRQALLLWTAAVMLAAVPATLLYVVVFRRPGAGAPISPEHLALGIGGTVILGGVVMGLASASFSTKTTQLLLSAWALVPLLATIALSSLTGWSILPIILVALPAWTLLAAYSLGSAPTVRGVMVLVLIAALGVPAQQTIRKPSGHGLAAAELAGIIAAESKPGDALVYGASDSEALIGRDLVARYLPASQRPADLLVTRAPRQDGKLYAAECPDPAECLAPAARVWVIRVGSPSSALDGFPAAKDGFLRVGFTAEKRWDLTGLSLTLFTPAASEPS